MHSRRSVLRKLVLIGYAAGAFCACVVTQAIDLNHELKSAEDACRAAVTSPSLDPIRNKVTLFRSVNDGPPPPSLAENDSFPKSKEIRAISDWIVIRSDCARRQDAVLNVPPGATPEFSTVMNEQFAGVRAIRTGIDSYVVLLGEGKVAYGEFEREHYTLVHQAAALRDRLLRAYTYHDESEGVAAKASFTTLLQAWDEYLTTVAKRHAKVEGRPTDT